MSAVTQTVKPKVLAPDTIKLVSHSMLFYWWPVWLVGFVLGWLSLVDGYRLAIVPEGTKLQAGPEESQGQTYKLVVPKNQADHLRQLAESSPREPFPDALAVSRTMGLVYCFVLLVVIFSTNIPLRGLWSAIVVLLLLLLGGLLAALNLWDTILDALWNLHIYITAAGYLFMSTVLFVFWVVTVSVFDQRRYIIFTPGQLVVHQEVGDMRQVYDTTNVIVEKRRSDFFRNILLGFFSGDLLVRIQGTQGQTFLLPNVLFAAWKVSQVAELMKTRPVISAASDFAKG
jgi:hypothetical protein